jgi:hypothetical protein
MVLNAARGRYSKLEFDLVHDSMRQLRLYAGMETDDVTTLQEAGLLKETTTSVGRCTP